MNARIRYELGNPFWLWLAAVLSMFIIMSLATGCKTTKNIQKEKETTHISSTDTAHKSEQVNRTIHRTTTEDFTAPVIIPQQTTQASSPLADLLSGGELTAEDDCQKATVKYDSATKTLRLQSTRKQQAVQVPGKRVIQEDITESIKKDSAGGKQQVIDTEKVTEKRDVKRTNYSLPVIGIVAAILFLLIIVFRKKIPFIKNFC